MNWKDALGVFHVYSKKNNSSKNEKLRIRFELQERPNITLEDALKCQPYSSLEKLRLLKLKYLV
jgi:hypothetical protein